MVTPMKIDKEFGEIVMRTENFIIIPRYVARRDGK